MHGGTTSCRPKRSSTGSPSLRATGRQPDAMELAISNIAWEPREDEAVREVLAAAGIRALEVAPTKMWSDPSTVPIGEALRYRAEWEARGFRLVAMQALLFGHPEMTIFENDERRGATHDYLLRIMELGA